MSKEISSQDIDAIHQDIEGSEISYLSPKLWTDKPEYQDEFLSSYLGIDPGSLTRGISRDGEGYNIQTALFGIEGTMDSKYNLEINLGEFVPRFNIGMILKKIQ